MSKKVLIVDDEPDMVKILEFRLKEAGCETVAAMNGQQAIDHVKAGGVGLVFLDYFLPDINGFEVSKKIREIDGSIPIIFISASKEKIDELPHMDNSDKLVKPIPPEVITQMKDKYMK